MSSPNPVQLWTLPDFSRPIGIAALPGPSGPIEDAYARAYADGMREGYREGLRDGARDGSVEAEHRFGSACDAIEAAAQALRDANAALALEVAETLTVLAPAVARRIIQREVTADRTVVPDLIRRAVETMTADAPPTVRLHPDDV